MLISELMEQIQNIQNVNGDIEVLIDLGGKSIDVTEVKVAGWTTKDGGQIDMVELG